MNEEKASISNKQFRDILICATWPTIINYGSGFVAREVGHDMWISGIISIFTTLPFIFIAVYIGQKFQGKTIVEYSQDLMGNFLGKTLGLVLTIYFFIYTVNSVSMYIHHLTAFLLPETPFLVVTALHIAIICYFVWEGPEVIARISVVGFSLAIVFHTLVFLASLAEIDINRILPAFNSGFIPTFKASLTADTFVGALQILVPMILPLVQDQKKGFRSAASGLFIGGAFFVFYFFVELLVMGPQLVALMRIASMDFVRSIQITEYLHRFESFMVALWYWSIFVQAGIFGSCSLQAFIQTTGIKKKNPGIMIVFGILLLVFTYIIGENRVFFLVFREHKWQYFSLPVQFGVPLLLLLCLGIRNVMVGSGSK